MIKQVQLRQKLARITAIRPFLLFLGLGLLALFVSSSVWGRLLTARHPSPPDPSQPAAKLLTPVALNWDSRDRTIAFSQIVELGATSNSTKLDSCHDMDVCLGYAGSHKIQQIVINPTLPVFDRSVETFGRIWLLAEQKWYLVLYLKINLSGPTR
jgi:hypothetical protein